MNECIIFVSEYELLNFLKLYTMNKNQHLIYQLEEAAANAWPARTTQTVDGWRLRYTDGVTRRANSVWPNLAPPHTQSNQPEIDERLATVEAFYDERNLPARFQICPVAQPSNLDQILAQKGYTHDALTNVQITTIDKILANNGLEKIEADHGNKVTITHQLNDAWFESYCQAETLNDHASHVRRGILQRITPLTGFASISTSTHASAEHLSPDALGLGVVERDWLGIFCMATKPAARRRGLASALLCGLATWGTKHGATNAYLQVMVSNSPAQKLYTRYGFETVYKYHYREKEKS